MEEFQVRVNELVADNAEPSAELQLVQDLMEEIKRQEVSAEDEVRELEKKIRDCESAVEQEKEARETEKLEREQLKRKLAEECRMKKRTEEALPLLEKENCDLKKIVSTMESQIEDLKITATLTTSSPVFRIKHTLRQYMASNTAVKTLLNRLEHRKKIQIDRH